jgi:sugar phosphate permease
MNHCVANLYVFPHSPPHSLTPSLTHSLAVKMSLLQTGVSPLTLAAMDSGFMFTYALGSFLTGTLGDRYSPVHIVTIGLLGSTLCLFLIVYGASFIITHVHSYTVCSVWFIMCQLLHGVFQATGGPVNTAIMGAWFTHSHTRGLVFGLWTCHQYVGDVVAALVSAYVLSEGVDWRWCVMIPAVLNAVWACVCLWSVPNTPAEAG